MVQNPLNEEVICGPFSLFDGSFILEFLEPHKSRNASVLMRATYPSNHPLTKTGTSHPQSPPLHLHFDQSETFQVLSGAVGTTQGYDVTKKVWKAEDGAQEIKPWVPHSFWPSHDSNEDSVLLVWAHPDGTPEAMDRDFFQSLLMYISDVHEKKVSLDVLQVMLMQHITATALVWFPTAWWLGPLRWWVPWKMQSAFAGIAKLFGKTPLMKEYTSRSE